MIYVVLFLYFGFWLCVIIYGLAICACAMLSMVVGAYMVIEFAVCAVFRVICFIYGILATIVRFLLIKPVCWLFR